VTPLEEAEKLLAVAAEDTQFRTVGSRAYFATFNRVKGFAIPLGFSPVRAGDDHKGLSQWLMSCRTNSVLVRIGRRLGDMRRIRNRADYDMSVTFTRGFALNLIQDARAIDGWIANMAPSMPPTPNGRP
jgi:uncharacterized protein (UPF0332 family)